MLCNVTHYLIINYNKINLIITNAELIFKEHFLFFSIWHNIENGRPPLLIA